MNKTMTNVKTDTDKPITIKELYEWAVANGLENNYITDIEENLIYSGSYCPFYTEEELKKIYDNEEDLENAVMREFAVSIT